MLQQFLQLEPRLDELLTWQDLAQKEPPFSAWVICLKEESLYFPLDWQNHLPPYLLPNGLAVCQDLVLGTIFGKLGNLEKATAYLGASHPLLKDFQALQALQHEWLLQEEWLSGDAERAEEAFEAYRIAHNQAIAAHYGSWASPPELLALHARYQEALALAPTPDYQAFTLWQYAGLLTDIGDAPEAQAQLEKMLRQRLSLPAEHSLKSLLATLLMQEIRVPYDWSLITQAKHLVWETMQYFESTGQTGEWALRLIDASEIANLHESYSESLSYINKAIQMLREEELPELLGQAQERKGTLLYTWAQSGQPQFYRGALQAWQEALKIFKKETEPARYAQIQHYLGVIFAEMPDEAQKKQLWATQSIRAFQEALLFFNEADYPYEYAQICNNFANALSKFPAALRADHYAQAIALYEKALAVRTNAWPYERAITLLNYLEAHWFQTQDEARLGLPQMQALWQTMQGMAEEVLRLVDDAVLKKEAEAHLRNLEELKIILWKDK
ncbi:MAG: hypothetical protein HC913_01300 [Microscillaceae bacterium]|nr:hypothetical protein [Microscillaceae bacterium]